VIALGNLDLPLGNPENPRNVALVVDVRRAIRDAELVPPPIVTPRLPIDIVVKVVNKADGSLLFSDKSFPIGISKSHRYLLL
jgi:hypothetical protein